MEARTDLRCFGLKISNIRSTGRVSFAGRGEEERGEFEVGAKTAASSRTGDRKNFPAKRNSNLPSATSTPPLRTKFTRPPWISR